MLKFVFVVVDLLNPKVRKVDWLVSISVLLLVSFFLTFARNDVRCLDLVDWGLVLLYGLVMFTVFSSVERR